MPRNRIFLNKQKHLLQISVCELHNDLILTVSQGRFSGARDDEVRFCIRDTSLRNYMPKKQWSTWIGLNVDVKHVLVICCFNLIKINGDSKNWQNLKSCITMPNQLGFLQILIFKTNKIIRFILMINTIISELLILHNNIIVLIGCYDKTIPKWDWIFNCCHQCPLLNPPFL